MAGKKKDPKSVLSKSFVDNHHDINEDEALELIYSANKQVKELNEEMTDDDQLNAAKQIVKDLTKGYTSAINYEKAKIEYLIERVEAIRANEVNPSSGLQ